MTQGERGVKHYFLNPKNHRFRQQVFLYPSVSMGKLCWPVGVGAFVLLLVSPLVVAPRPDPYGGSGAYDAALQHGRDAEKEAQ